ncbi:hypothetical protein [Streptomyces graminilatus]|uniref:hypothetical protein n=1 Tax=Streptomyces graminilatus TaxID=1464070 RepID=UPI0006E2362D|nr:hypothetical protein [Streptomyces graminilatus]
MHIDAAKIVTADDRGRRVRRFVVVLLWGPCAAVLGPVVGMRHGGFAQMTGGAVVISVPVVTAWGWERLEGRKAKPSGSRAKRATPAVVLGFLVGAALTLCSYGHAERMYAHLFVYPRTVVIAEVRCAPAKNGCTRYDLLSTPRGHRLPLRLYDIADGREAGQTLTVRWDRIGYASPTSTTYPGVPEPYEGDAPLLPAWAFTTVAALHTALTAHFAYQGSRLRGPTRGTVADRWRASARGR